MSDSEEYTNATTQYIQLLNGSLADSLLAKLEANISYDKQVFRLPTDEKSAAKFYKLVKTAALEAMSGTDDISRRERKVNSWQLFEAIKQGPQEELPPFIRRYRVAYNGLADILNYTEQKRVHDVMRRMYSTELYDLCKKSIVQYPSTFEELMILAPKFRNKQADVPKKADHIFMTADKKTISVPGKNKDSGRYDRVEPEIWDKLTK